MTHPNEALIAEVRRRFQRSNSAWTDEAFDLWLADATQHGATLVLELNDGARADYPRQSAPACHVARAMDQNE